MKDSIISQRPISQLEKELLSILNFGISLSSPAAIINDYVSILPNNSIKIGGRIIPPSNGKLYILGWGKVAGAMAEAIESKLGEKRIAEGIIISPLEGYNLKKIKLFKGSHPFPSKENIYASKQIVKLAEKCSEEDNVICLISGGGSSLLCLPAKGVSLREKRETTEKLIKAGIGVEKINIIRKHLSKIKGGKLAKLIYPANITNLIISDDVNDKIESIASGATTFDSSTFADALGIIKQYNLTDSLPKNIINYLQFNLNIETNETIKRGSTLSKKIRDIIIFNNRNFLGNLKKISLENDLKNVYIYPKTFYGRVNHAIYDFSSFIQEIKKKCNNDFLVLAGGEVEIKTSSIGKGGRAQHFAALMIPELERIGGDSAFAAVATDGRDFIKGIAGALITHKTKKKLIQKNINYEEYIRETKTFNIHNQLGTHLYTVKPTQMNVFDVYMFLHKNKQNKKWKC